MFNMKYLAVFFFLMMQSCMGYSQDWIGTWAGKLNFGSQNLTLVLHLSQESGNWMAKADSPDQGAYGLPFSARMSKDSIYLSNPQGIKLQLKLESKNQLKGEFSQGGMTLPLVLHRGESQAAIPPAAKYQTPAPPYPYDTTEVVIPNDYARIKLSGTLTQPKDEGKYPAVILVTGSGPQDRDESLFGHKPFHVLADYLTRNGVVVLRYDDRGVGKSEGSFENSTIDDFSKDAIAALQYLKQVEKVDINKIGIIGHSEGGLIANLLAGQGLPNLSYIVTLAGPTIPIWELMVEQLYRVGKAEGMSEFQLAMAKDINKKNFDVVKSELATDAAFTQLKKNMNILEDSPKNEAMRKEILMMLTPAYRYFVRIDPRQFIKNIYIPVYGAFGSLDIQVPSKINMDGYSNYLPKNSKTVIKEYESMNHLFQKAKTGRVAEYGQLAETINEEVLKDITDWIKGL